MKRLHFFGFFLVLTSFLPFYSSAKEMTLQNKAGQELDCHFISLEGEVVRVRRVSDDREFDLTLDQLSKSSVRLVMEQAASEEEVPVSGTPVLLTERFNAEVELKKGRKMNLSKQENYDDKVETLCPGIWIQNKDFYQSLGPQKATLIHYGQSVTDKSKYRVLAREDFTFTVLPRKDFTFEGKVYQNLYDKWNYAKFGYPYKGAIFVAWEDKSKSKATYIRSSMPKLREDPSPVLKMKVGQYLDRNGQPYRGR